MQLWKTFQHEHDSTIAEGQEWNPNTMEPADPLMPAKRLSDTMTKPLFNTPANVPTGSKSYPLGDLPANVPTGRISYQ